MRTGNPLYLGRLLIYMITDRLDSEDGTVLKCHTQRQGKPVILMYKGDKNHVPDISCCYEFIDASEIDWLIKKLRQLKKIHFNE